MNQEKQSICDQLVLTLKSKFPETVLIETIENPENLHCDVWMRFKISKDIEIDFVELVANLTTDILVSKDFNIRMSYQHPPLEDLMYQ